MPIVIDADARTDIPVSIRLEDYTVTTFDVGTEIAFSSATAVTCNLSAASTVGNGFTAVIRNIGAGTLTIDPFGTETVDGSTTVALAQDEWRWLRCDGTNWESVARSYDISGCCNVTAFRTTESSDVALATCVSGGTQVGSDISATIPTSGRIKVVMESGILDYPGSNASYGIGVDVNGTAYFATASRGGTTTYQPMLNTNSASDTTIGGAQQTEPQVPASVTFDIAGNSIATGSQTVKVLMGDEAISTQTGAGTLNGASDTAIFHVEIVEMS